ncbi:MAG TPA: hypothetical protein VFX80_09600 [Solirubrobacteraceae bacterium]|nr:hypothetical protein [Solirubrobacteraceae bacterium]
MKMPPYVLQAFERALGDLQSDQPIDLQVVGLEGDLLVVREAGEPDTTGLWIPPDAGFEELVVAFADQLQEQVFPESRGAWGQARPPCPGHNHPARAELVGDQAMWVCPVSELQLRRIGG